MNRLAYRAVVCTCPTCTSTGRPLSLGMMCPDVSVVEAHAILLGWTVNLDSRRWQAPSCCTLAIPHAAPVLPLQEPAP